MSRYQTDIKLSEDWQLTPHANGDVLLVTDLECLMQDIRLEALTSEGDLFYDTDYGWSLLDFAQVPYSELVELELEQRIMTKLSKREEVNIKSIIVKSKFNNDAVVIQIEFRFVDSDELQYLSLEINRLNIEVIPID